MHGYEYIRKLNGKFRKRSIGKLWEYDRLVYVTSGKLFGSPVYKRPVITVYFVLYLARKTNERTNETERCSRSSEKKYETGRK